MRLKPGFLYSKIEEEDLRRKQTRTIGTPEAQSRKCSGQEEDMAVSNTKLRTLYIMKTLLERSDEEHVLSAADLEKALKAQGLTADRKTIYGDIETLESFGLDIVQVKGGVKAGCYIASRDFQLPELKLLVDAVQASKFITTKKSRELISKLEKLTSENNANQLQRDVFIINRPKADNETIYYNVDRIHEALSRDRRIDFQYTEWSMEKKLVPKRGGRYYNVSPWALTWDDENYYLIAYEEESGRIKHYRVDKMRNVTVSGEMRLGREKFDGFDLASFAKKTFGMYGGVDEKVSLLCEARLVGVMLDRFGREITIVPEGSERFRLTVPVSVSPQFFGWITGLGRGVSIEGPEDVKEEYKRYIEGILERYEG